MKTDVYTSVISYHEPVTPLGRLLGGGYIHHKIGYLHWRVLGCYALVYVLEGAGRYQDAAGFSQEVAAGDLLLLFPELAHRYGPGAAGTWAEFHITFEGPAFDLWRETGILDSRIPVWNLHPVAEWLTSLTTIVPPQACASAFEGMVSVSRLLTVLTEAAAAQSNVCPPVAALPWLNRARHLLEADLSRKLTAAEVAMQMGLSYETFRKTFERQVGLSPARYRAMKRLDAARALLQHTPMTSRQIADSLGFPDEFYFSRRFRECFGVSPRAYRRQANKTSG